MADDDGTDFFSQLFQHEPDIFHQILQYLPIQERIRCKRVNSHWRDQCQWSITHHPGQIDFGAEVYKKIDRNQLRDLLIHCREKLVGARFCEWSKKENQIPKCSATRIIKSFAKYSYPNMERIDVEWKPSIYHGIGLSQRHIRYCNLFIDAIGCCPILKIIRIDGLKGDQIDWARLKNVNVNFRSFEAIRYWSRPNQLKWLTENCPNLQRFKCDISIKFQPPMHDEFRLFFQRCRQLSEFSLVDSGMERFTASELLEQVAEFWSLSHMRKLLGFIGMGNRFITLVAESFPLLEEIWVYAKEDVTTDAITALARLPNLKSVTFDHVDRLFSASLTATAALTAIINNGKLRMLKLVHCRFDYNCLLSIAQSCPNLKNLRVFRSSNEPTIDQCIQLIRQIKLHLRPRHQLKLKLVEPKWSKDQWMMVKGVWDEPAVQKFAKQLSNLDQDRSITGIIGSLIL